jgi:hypothetical protein
MATRRYPVFVETSTANVGRIFRARQRDASRCFLTLWEKGWTAYRVAPILGIRVDRDGDRLAARGLIEARLPWTRQTSAWLRKLDEECPYQMVLEGTLWGCRS